MNPPAPRLSVILCLTGLDATNAEYDLPPGSTDELGMALTMRSSTYRALDRPGTLQIDLRHPSNAAVAAPAGTPGETDDLGAPRPGRAWVLLFKAGGKYYTSEDWRIPTELDDDALAAGASAGDLIGPYAMRWSPDFRRIGNGAVLVPSQEPWGYPHLIVP